MSVKKIAQNNYQLRNINADAEFGKTIQQYRTTKYVGRNGLRREG